MARYRTRIEELAEAIINLRWSEMEHVCSTLTDQICDSGEELSEKFSLAGFLSSWAEYVDGEYRTEEG